MSAPHPLAVSRRKATVATVDLDAGEAVCLWGDIPFDVVGSDAEQLTLTSAALGDIAVRYDTNVYYTRNAGTAGTMADWDIVTDGVGIPWLPGIVLEAGDTCLVDIVADSPLITATYTTSLPWVSAEVATSQSTTSTAYTNLATVGPSVDINLMANQWVLVTISCAALIATNGVSASANMSFAISGADTLAASDGMRITTATQTASGPNTYQRTFAYQAASAGLMTFTAKYKTSNATYAASFLYRSIIVDART